MSVGAKREWGSPNEIKITPIFIGLQVSKVSGQGSGIGEQ
jgi:hypothetical protein